MLRINENPIHYNSTLMGIDSGLRSDDNSMFDRTTNERC